MTRRALLPHQQKIFDQVMGNPQEKRWGLFLDMGLGKTLLSCAIAGSRGRMHDKVYIFCPASLQANWKAEIKKDDYMHGVNYEVLPYSMLSNKKSGDIVITNDTLLILDESHYLKNPTSNRARYFLSMLKKVDPWIISMTGTPDPKNIMDMWVQCCLLNAWTGGLLLSVRGFETVYAKVVQMGQFKKIVGEVNREHLLKGFRGKAFFIKKEDVLDLPEKMYDRKAYDLTAEQKKYFKDLKKDAMSQTELTQDYIMASMHNYIAICSGFVRAKFDSDGNQYPEPKIIDLKKNPKLSVCEDIVLGLGKKQFILYCVYHKEMEMLSQMLAKNDVSYVSRSGRNSEGDNDMAVKKFVGGGAQVMLATVQSTSTGLTFTNCDTMIYYSNTYDLLHRAQSEDRIHRIGQKEKCLYIDIAAAGGPDEILLRNLKAKRMNMDETFKLFLEGL